MAFSSNGQYESYNFESFPEIGALLVSKMITEHNMQPRFLYREKRMRADDSGWRIFSGFESESYNDDPDTSGLYDVVTILHMDPSLQDILLAGVGSVYEKAADNSGWNSVADFKLEDDYMVTHRLTGVWTMDINNLFERSIEETGDLFYTTGDKSVRLVIWNEEDTPKDFLYTNYQHMVRHRDQSVSPTLETFDFSDAAVLRTGYLIGEEQAGKPYHVLFGFSIIDQEVLQAAFYFDAAEDLDWALATWQQISVGSNE